MVKTNVRQHMRRTKRGSVRVTKHSRSLKNMSFSQLQTKGIKLNPHGDADKDGVMNIKDCRPLNKHQQGFVHELLKKAKKQAEAKAKKRDKKLEAEQDRLLKQLDNEQIKLKKSRLVQKRVHNNLVLKQELKRLRAANFRATPTGRIVAILTDPKSGKKTKKGFNKFLKEIGA